MNEREVKEIVECLKKDQKERIRFEWDWEHEEIRIFPKRLCALYGWELRNLLKIGGDLMKDNRNRVYYILHMEVFDEQIYWETKIGESTMEKLLTEILRWATVALFGFTMFGMIYMGIWIFITY